ncbi:MAG: hypothetical protein V9E88_15360 [Ferruginibacter sp.]
MAQLQTIQVIYGTCTTSSTTTLNVQVGLRGATSSDFNARTTTTNWSATTAAVANTNTLSFSNTINPSSGLTFTWSPCITSPGVAGAISGAGSVCVSIYPDLFSGTGCRCRFLYLELQRLGSYLYHCNNSSIEHHCICSRCNQRYIECYPW